MSIKVTVNNTEGNLFQQGVDKVKEGYSSFTDKVVEFELGLILKPIGNFFKEIFYSLIDLLNNHSVEIITGGIVGCALLMMVSPLWGQRGGVWVGRIVAIAMVGTLWRMVI